MDIRREIADKYQELFNLMTQEHSLTLTISEMDEIIIEAKKVVNNLSKPDVKKSVNKTHLKKAEEILREYVQFDDVNGNKCVTLLPLTIVDAMEEYAEFYTDVSIRSYFKNKSKIL